MKENLRPDPGIVDDLIDNIYEAIDNNVAWSRVLRTIDTITGASCSAILSMKHIDNKVYGNNFTTDGYQSEFLEYQQDMFFRDNIVSALKGIGTGEIISSVDLLGRDGTKSSTVYREFYEKFEFVHFIGMNLFISDDTWVSLGSFRGPHAFPRGTLDKRIFERIAPHILRSMKVSQTVDSWHAETNAVLETIEMLHHAAFLLDRQRRVISMNGMGKALVERGEVRIDADGVLEMEPRRLGWGKGNSHPAKKASTHVAAAFTATTEGDRGRTGMMIFNMEARCAGIFPSLSRQASELVLVFDAGARLASMITHVRNDFGLTCAEARVFEAAMTHSSSYEIADALGLSRETIRSHMKHIFLKMDISSHVELLQYFALHSTADKMLMAC